MKTKYCTSCGAPLREGLAFCVKCGAKVKADKNTNPGKTQNVAPKKEEVIAPDPMPESKENVIKEVPAPVEINNSETLVRRAELFLEEKDFSKALDYCEKALDVDPENARAYVCRLAAKKRLTGTDKLADLDQPLDDDLDFKRAVRFAPDELKAKLNECNDGIKQRLENERLESIYDKAVSAAAGASSESELLSCAGQFEAIAGYRDSAARASALREKAAELQEKVLPVVNNEPDEGSDVDADEDKDEDKVENNRDKKINRLIAVMLIVGGLALAAVAVSLLFIMGVFNNTPQKSKVVQVGDTITFGKYEQDNDLSNGAEDIEWIVLSIEDNKALVISKYALDCKAYNYIKTNITWEYCSIRKWLNDSFYNSAFSSEEQTKIEITTVYNDVNPDFTTLVGSATEDKVFLLSISEVRQYFSSEESLECIATEYAKRWGVYTYTTDDNIDGNDTCWWWLRTPGAYSMFASSVTHNGLVDTTGQNVTRNNNAVRPAMWIDIGS